MTSEANMVEKKEKGKAKEEVTDEPQSQLQPQTEKVVPPMRNATPPQLQPQTEKPAPPVPTATPPPPPEQDSAAWLSLPPSPPQKDATLRPVPPSHPATRGLDRELPQPFPVSYYDPDHVQAQSDERRERANPPDTRWDFLKLTLSTLSLIFSAVIVGLGVAIASWGGRDSEEEAYFGLTCTTAVLAIIWTVAEAFTMCFSRKRRGIHPGAHVGCHLIIWLMAIAAVAFLSILMQYGYYNYGDGWESYPVRKLLVWLAVFTGLLAAVHLILFIRACVETHRLNRLKVRYIRVPVPVPVQLGGGMSGVPYRHPYPGFPQPYPQSNQQPYPQMAVAPAPDQMMYGQSQGKGSVPPQQAVLYGGYYAPAAPPPSTLLQGYYGPPERRSSTSRTHHSQQPAPLMVSSGSGSRRARPQKAVSSLPESA